MIGHFIGLDHTAPLGTGHNDPTLPIMNQFWFYGVGPTNGGWTNLTLKAPDVDGENFMYCPDMGDAPDPWMGVAGLYPSLVHIPGAGRTLNGVVLDGWPRRPTHLRDQAAAGAQLDVRVARLPARHQQCGW